MSSRVFGLTFSGNWSLNYVVSSLVQVILMDLGGYIRVLEIGISVCKVTS